MSNVCIGNCRRRDISSSSVRSFRCAAASSPPGWSRAFWPWPATPRLCRVWGKESAVCRPSRWQRWWWRRLRRLHTDGNCLTPWCPPSIQKSHWPSVRPAAAGLGWTDRCNEEGRGDRRVGRRRRRTDGQVAHRLLALPLSLSPSLPPRTAGVRTANERSQFWPVIETGEK